MILIFSWCWRSIAGPPFVSRTHLFLVLLGRAHQADEELMVTTEANPNRLCFSTSVGSHHAQVGSRGRQARDAQSLRCAMEEEDQAVLSIRYFVLLLCGHAQPKLTEPDTTSSSSYC